MAVTADITAATVTAVAMVDGASDWDLDSGTAAITAIRTPMDIHITAAATIRTLTTPIPTRMELILTMALRPSNSSISTDRLHSNNNSMAPNTVRNMGRSPISAKVIRHSRIAIRRHLRRTGRNKTPRRPQRRTILLALSPRPTTTSPMASGIALVTLTLSSAKGAARTAE